MQEGTAFRILAVKRDNPPLLPRRKSRWLRIPPGTQTGMPDRADRRARTGRSSPARFFELSAPMGRSPVILRASDCNVTERALFRGTQNDSKSTTEFMTAGRPAACKRTTVNAPG